MTELTFPDPTKGPREQEDVILLALTVLGEARGEPGDGKVAVAHVVANRMRRTGKSVADTVLAPWQFSCWNPGDPNKLFLTETISKAAGNISVAVWSSCWVAAWHALHGTVADPTHGATHYTVSDIWGVDDSKRKRKRWHSRQLIEAGETVETARIGAHVFGSTA